MCEEGKRFKGLRVVGNADYFNNKLLEYEAIVNKILPKRCIALCLYDKNRVDSGFLFKIVQMHPTIISKDCNPYSHTDDAGGDPKGKVSEGIIKELEETKEKLKSVEVKYREIFDNTMDVVVITNLKGEFIEINSTFEEILGYRRDEVIGKSFKKVVAEEYIDFLVESYKKAFKEKKNIRGIEFEVQTKKGKKIFFEGNISLLKDKDKIVAFLGIFRDITDRKKMVESLKEREEMFRSIAEKSLVGVYLIQDGVFKYVNPRFAELWGYEVDEIVGRSPLEFIHPADKETVKQNIEMRIKGDVDAIRYTLKMIRKDGEVRINEVYGSRVIYKGRPAVIGTLIDITEEMRTKKKLEEYMRFYQNAQDMFFILDTKGRFVDVNPKYAELLGYSKEEIVGHTARRLMDLNELDMVKENFNKVLRGEHVRYKAKAISKDGKKYIMEVVLWPVYEKGKIVGAEGILRDVTELVRLNKLLNAINNINKHIVREKDKIGLINEVTEELGRLEYFTCWIGVKHGDELITTSPILKTLNIKNLKNNITCLRKAMTSGEFVLREGDDEDCKECEFYEKHLGLKRYAFPLYTDGSMIGGLVVYSENELPTDELELLQTLAKDLAFAIKSIEIEQEKIEAIKQIEKNIENYAILIDHIRNPLAIISGIAETKLEDGENIEEVKEIILKAVSRIEDVIKRLDEGCLESEEIRSFIMGEVKDQGDSKKSKLMKEIVSKESKRSKD